MILTDCCILNSGNGAWAFEPLAEKLSEYLNVEISGLPRRFNYLLHVENGQPPKDVELFIPYPSIQLAADKRLIAAAFIAHDVPRPRTELHDTFSQVLEVVAKNPESQWCLKYPTSCGASGHRLVSAADPEPANWPKPFVLQEFIRMENPEVYRIYCAGGELFGWVVRRFPKGTHPSPWVAHARGARYVNLGEPPAAAVEVARRAMIATGLLNSFGCTDLLRTPSGEWVALEVGTDGLFNHVDRDLADPALEHALFQRIATAFWKAAEGFECASAQHGLVEE